MFLKCQCCQRENTMNKKSLENRVSSVSEKLEDTIKGQTIYNNHFLNRICEVEANANFRSNQTNRELAVTQNILAIVIFCVFLFSLVGDFMYRERIIELQKEVAELQVTIKQFRGNK